MKTVLKFVKLGDFGDQFSPISCEKGVKFLKMSQISCEIGVILELLERSCVTPSNTELTHRNVDTVFAKTCRLLLFSPSVAKGEKSSLWCLNVLFAVGLL